MQETALSRKGCIMLPTTIRSSQLFILHTHHADHTANTFATMVVEKATPIQLVGRLDTQCERRVEEQTMSVACTNKASGRKPWSRKKEASASAPTQADTFSARREATDGLSARREPMDKFSARWELPICAAQNIAWSHKSSYFLLGKAACQTMLYLRHRLQHQSGEQEGL